MSKAGEIMRLAEREIGHTFKADLSLAQVQQEIADGAQGGAGEWGKAL